MLSKCGLRAVWMYFFGPDAAWGEPGAACDK